MPSPRRGLLISCLRDVGAFDSLPDQDWEQLLRDSLERSDELDNALSEEAVNSAAVATASQRLGASCQSCHTQYRVQDPSTKAYRVKLQ